MAASLIPKEGGSPIALDKPIMLIGRNQDCDISLQISSKISRRHCCIVQCGDRYVLRDLGSMNGVRVNDNRIVEAELKPGDEVAVADVAFTFRADGGRTRSNDGSLQQNRPDSPAVTAESQSVPETGDQYEVVLSEDSEQVRSSESVEDDDQEQIGLKHDSESEAGFLRV